MWVELIDSERALTVSPLLLSGNGIMAGYGGQLPMGGNMGMPFNQQQMGNMTPQQQQFFMQQQMMQNMQAQPQGFMQQQQPGMMGYAPPGNQFAYQQQQQQQQQMMQMQAMMAQQQALAMGVNMPVQNMGMGMGMQQPYGGMQQTPMMQQPIMGGGGVVQPGMLGMAPPVAQTQPSVMNMGGRATGAMPQQPGAAQQTFAPGAIPTQQSLRMGTTATTPTTTTASPTPAAPSHASVPMPQPAAPRPRVQSYKDRIQHIPMHPAHTVQPPPPPEVCGPRSSRELTLTKPDFFPNRMRGLCGERALPSCP